MLADRGFSPVYALLGGWDAWLAAKYPTEAVPPEEQRGGTGDLVTIGRM
ncbi:MAG: hypothetical protein NTZ05_06055 [Chloroflexi bacterium]|nr:hypothetical protein [Chloroflexota bacterium]